MHSTPYALIGFIVLALIVNSINATKATWCQSPIFSNATISDDKKKAVATKDDSYVQTCQSFKWNSNKRICMKFQNNPSDQAYIGVVSTNAAWYNNRPVVQGDNGQDCWFGENGMYCDGKKKFNYPNKPTIAPGDVLCVRFNKGYLTFVRNNVRMTPAPFPLKKNTRYFVIGYGYNTQTITLTE